MKLIISIISVILVICSMNINAQSITIEENTINTILKSSSTDEFKREDLSKKWKKFIAEYNYPELPIDSTTNILSFNKTIIFDSIDKKLIYNRCEQWLVLSYFQIIYSNCEAGKIIATASSNIPHKAEVFSFTNKTITPTNTKTDYVLTITIKNNKLKYELSDIRYYTQITDSEYTNSINDLFPIITKNRSEWYKLITYLESLNNKIFIELSETLENYINYSKQDYDF